MAKLSPGQEAYYEASVARGIDDYYAGRGESPGVWHGGGAAGLGLVGIVADGDLGRLMGGVDPASGVRLRAAVVELRPVAGFDLVFGAPKSVSLLHALGDERVRFEIAQAHQAAWQAALDYLEDVACVTRRGRNGVVRERAGGFVASAFAHRTSRALEPHLHTHVIVANAAQSPDGRWRALDGDLLLRTHRLAAGSLYQAQLRYELTSRLGVDWQPVEKGLAEIHGVPEAALRAFSTRRAQVVAHLAEHATTGWRAAQVAAVATRDPKSTPDLVELRDEWEARATAHGFGPLERDAILAELLQSELDDITRRAALGLPDAARQIALGLLLGLANCRDGVEDGTVIGYAGPDVTDDLAWSVHATLAETNLELPEAVLEDPSHGRDA